MKTKTKLLVITGVISVLVVALLLMLPGWHTQHTAAEVLVSSLPFAAIFLYTVGYGIARLAKIIK